MAACGSRIAPMSYVSLFATFLLVKPAILFFVCFIKITEKEKTMGMFYTFFVFLYYIRRSVFLRSDSQSKIVIVLFSRFADSSFVSIN